MTRRHLLPLSTLSILAAAVTVPAVIAAPYPAETATMSEEIEPAEVIAAIEWLSDDARMGRSLLNDGRDAAADFIATQFKAIGLQEPDADDFDGYFQSFDVGMGRQPVPEETTLAAEGVDDLKVGEGFEPFGWAAEGEFEGELVFGGYGIDTPNYKDLEGTDVKGKVVLMFRYEPHDEEGNSRLTGTDNRSPAAQFFRKVANAEEAGAAAVLIVNPPKFGPEGDVLPPTGGGRRRATGGIPAFGITQAAANELLAAAELPDLATLQDEIDSTGEPASQAGNGLVVRGQSKSEDTVAIGKNVVGILPGKNADEFVVVGAHFDHVGHGEYGSGDSSGAVHNGADDNASGTSAVLEIAEAFAMEAKNGNVPERTLVFALFDAEELGLLGSRHLVEHMPVPTDEIVGMVNLDMIGRLREDTVYVGGANTVPGLQKTLDAMFEASPLKSEIMDSSFDGRSDHANFIRNDIPAIFLFTGLHPEYHGPDDDAPLINEEGLAQIATMAKELMVAMSEGDRETTLKFQGPQQANAQASRPNRAGSRMGVTFGDSDNGGVLLASVDDAESAMAKAGLEDGDVIVAFDGDPVNSQRDLFRAATFASRSGVDSAKLIVLRDGEYMTLDMKLSN